MKPFKFFLAPLSGVGVLAAADNEVVAPDLGFFPGYFAKELKEFFAIFAFGFVLDGVNEFGNAFVCFNSG